MGMHPDTEKALQDRDERVARLLVSILRNQQEQIEALDEERRQIERHVKHINTALDAEKWHALRGVLMDEDIESLCEWSPTAESMRDLMRELGE